jgi:hypothetical protein
MMMMGPPENGLPLYLLGSWGFAMWWAVMRGILQLFPTYGYEAGNWSFIAIGLSVYALYFFGLMILNNRLRQVNRFPIPIIPLAIHLAGIIVCLIAFGQGKAENAWFLILPACVAFGYFFLEWRLALRIGRQVKSVGTSAGQTGT